MHENRKNVCILATLQMMDEKDKYIIKHEMSQILENPHQIFTSTSSTTPPSYILHHNVKIKSHLGALLLYILSIIIGM